MYYSAIAASAPILQFPDIVACEAFGRITTLDFRTSHPTCPELIRKSWGAIMNVTSNGNEVSLYTLV